MTDYLAPLYALEEAATKGEWKWEWRDRDKHRGDTYYVNAGPVYGSIAITERTKRGYENARLIAIQRNLLRPMLDVIAPVLEAYEEEAEWRSRHPSMPNENIKPRVPFGVVATFKQAVEKELG